MSFPEESNIFTVENPLLRFLRADDCARGTGEKFVCLGKLNSVSFAEIVDVGLSGILNSEFTESALFRDSES